MALYAIGDIQGCRVAFDALLDAISFDAGNDHLVLVGDLVNRGPDSLGVLERIGELGDSVTCVLGNHDLNALAIAEGIRPAKPKDTMSTLLESEKANSHLDWLRHLPLMVRRDGWIFCHAGIYPLWDESTALECAREVETALRGDEYREFLGAMYGSLPDTWQGDLAGLDRLRFIANAFTRMRYVSHQGALELSEAGPPGTQGKDIAPWFEFAGRRPIDATIVFGHWSSLGYHHGNGVIGLDTGCVWGRTLTAVRLDTTPVITWCVNCKDSV
jgi:bis(5'-nucleosyl)-tetraphosphatase (symmetrical)